MIVNNRVRFKLYFLKLLELITMRGLNEIKFCTNSLIKNRNLNKIYSDFILEIEIHFCFLLYTKRLNILSEMTGSARYFKELRS